MTDSKENIDIADTANTELDIADVIKRSFTKRTRSISQAHNCWNPTKLTERQIGTLEALAATLNLDQIADYFNIPKMTFVDLKNRDPAVDSAFRAGRAKAIATLGENLYMRAFKSDSLAIFYMKTQGGWKEQQDVNITHAESLPRITLNVDKVKKHKKKNKASEL